MSGATLCLFLDDVTCNGAGHCAGDASIEFTGTLDGSGAGSFEAKAKCVATENPDDKVCSASLLVPELVGTVNACDLTLENLKVKGPVDSSGFFEGKASTRLCVQCAGDDRPQCTGAKGSFEYGVNPPIPWNLTVNAQPTADNPARFEGTASDSLGFHYQAVGTHSSKNDVSQFLLRGDADTASEGAKVKLNQVEFSGSDVSAGTANIKVQGNKINQTPLAP